MMLLNNGRCFKNEDMKNFGLIVIDCSISDTNVIVIFYVDYSFFLSMSAAYDGCTRGVVF